MEDLSQASTEATPVAKTPSGSMEEYYALQKELLVTTLILVGIAFPAVGFFYDLQVALNYLLGAFAGVIYLRLLGKNVEKLGQESGSIGKSQIAIFVGVMILASQVKQLSILPVFLGFLTYKATLIIYTLRVLFASNRSTDP